MKILALDTSNRVSSVAIIDEEKVIAEYLLDVREGHSRKLLYLVNQILKDSELTIKKIDGFAVAVGPGSFTALRVGIATAKGLAIGAKKPLCGIPTLDVLAANVWTTGLICPILDAKARWVYGAVYQYHQSELRKVIAEFLLPLKELFKKIRTPTVFLGNAVLIHQGLIEKELGKDAFFAPQEFSLVRAANVAKLALRKLRAGEVPELSGIKPIYLERKRA
ncbi:MAG: tRNA threonylcarbamoyladenosine biosynthesis protein TsaB [Syntrophomonadaceae bacterium]|nr:tRNA threonylcarbamoyladenosine biosynthesis protein TsaB [Bacillota bacterium]